MSLDYLCRWQVQVSVYCDWRISAHLRCIQCSILLLLMDICYLSCICLWQISQFQTCLCVVVGPGFVSRFYEEQRQPSRWRICPKTVNRAPLLGAGGFDIICTAICDHCDNSTACRLCCLEPGNSRHLTCELDILRCHFSL